MRSDSALGSGGGWDHDDRPPWWPGRRGHALRPLVAALLSCLLPGAGQLYLGRLRRGAALLAVSAACLGAGLALWAERDALPQVLVQPTWLMGLLVVDAVLLAFRVACVVDAYRLGAAGPGDAPPPGRRHLLVLTGMVLVLALTASPHLVAGYYDLQAYTLLASVFGGGADPPAGRQRVAGAVGQERSGATPDRMTVLLLGGDAGPGRSGLRTDSIIVADLNLRVRRVSLFGLPRNLIRVPLPAGPAQAFDCRCFPYPLSELYTFAEGRRDLFPGTDHPGVAAVAGAAELLLGLPIDHYALVDLKGFVEVLDALGGVTVTVTRPVYIEVDTLGKGGGATFNVQPGRHHLNGTMALAYVRTRKYTSDYDRMRRQRCLLGALAREAEPGRLLGAFPRLARAIRRSVRTDIPVGRLPDFVALAGQGQVRVTTVGFVPPQFSAGRTRGGYPIPDVDRIQRTVRATLNPPRAAAPPTSGTVAPPPSRPGRVAPAQPPPPDTC